MSISIAGSADAWINSLTDPGVSSDVSRLAADGVLSYADLLQILTDVATRGAVTQAEFGDLQIIAAHLNVGVSTPAHAAAAFIQLVDGNPANAFWNGGATATALGNLAAGTSAADLGKLIGKWFLGSDMPDPALPADETPEATSYAAFTDTLYGSSGAPQVADVGQGDLGDCELGAALIALAAQNPGRIESMFVDDGNGVYSVRFTIGGDEVWETVNDQLPVFSGYGRLAFQNADSGDTQVFWADLAEKAYAQLAETGEIGLPAGKTQNAYASIDGLDTDDVLNNLSGGSSVVNYAYSDTNWNADKEIFIAALASGEDLIVNSYSGTRDSQGHTEFVALHAFAIVGYDAATGDFILRNPWGTDGQGLGYDVQFEASMNDIAGVDGDVAVDNANQTALRVLTIPQGYQDAVWVGGQEIVGAGSSAPVASWFTTVDGSGASVTEYRFEVAGPGSIDLDGATDLATSAQHAEGQTVVSAGDLSKVLFAGAGAAVPSTSTLIVWAYDGATWSAAADIAVSIAATALSVTPKVETLVAPSGTIALSSLFQAEGIGSSPGVFYDIEVASGGGTVNLNGAYNYQGGGYDDVSAASFPLLTFTAPAAAGITRLQVAVGVNYGWIWSAWQSIDVITGASAADAIQDFDDGRLAATQAVADTAAAIGANLDGLQTMLAAGALDGILITDNGVIAINAGQLKRDAGALGAIANSLFEVVASGAATYIVGGNGRTGTPIAVSASGGAVDLKADSNMALTGSGDGVFSGAGSTFTVTGGADQINFQGSGDVANLIDAGSAWDLVTGLNGATGTIDLTSAGANITGGGDTVVFSGGGNNSASLINTVSAWDLVTGLNGATGTVYLTNAGANISGGGDAVEFFQGASNSASLINTFSAWDNLKSANGASGTVYLTSAGANIAGGGDTVEFYGGAGNSASLTNTVSAWDNVKSANGATGTVYLTNAGANIAGGGDTVEFYAGANNSASLINTVSAWDNVKSVNGATGTVYLTNAGANITGGGDTVDFYAGASNSASLINTGTAPDTVKSANGATGTVDLSNAQASISGAGDMVDFWSGASNSASLSGTDSVLFNQKAFGLDTVNGYTSADPLSFNIADQGHLAISQSGASTLITFDAADVVTLTNVSVSSLGSITYHS
ncbi:C1A family cysteine protease [Roseiarcus fermentans]|uniref:C1A family cysteine protease n=1 Tax=Roseiarcus fermentans TaxID=1473586 RepID=A0A366FBB3_9HYPH|nr:C2 family cysteine protease [Roseiarcus fermentans]RBP11928.1 C1A family cysteine protease [Roseiarcus fermentans]